MTQITPPPTSRIPHRIGVVLATMVFPLIWLGGLVTTFDAGMAVPDWPNTYGYNMFLYPIETWLFGPFDLLVEHGHRLLASLAGLVAIALVIFTYRLETRGWVKKLSVGLLTLIILQGLLGGARVLLDDRVFATIHGCLGPAFFCGVVGFCVATSRWWLAPPTDHSSPPEDYPTWFGYSALILLLISYGQLVMGALIRHVQLETPPYVFRGLVIAHVTMATLIVIGTFFQWFVSRKRVFCSSGIRASVNWVVLLVFVQFCLGFTTWVVKFGWPIWFIDYDFAASFVIGEKTFLQMNLITAHVAVGSLILAFWTVHLMRCHRFAYGSSSRF